MLHDRQYLGCTILTGDVSPDSPVIARQISPHKRKCAHGLIAALQWRLINFQP